MQPKNLVDLRNILGIRLVPPGGIGAELGVGSELVPGTRRRTEESLDSEACLGEGSRSFQNRLKTLT